MKNEKHVYKYFKMKLRNRILAYFFSSNLRGIPITHSQLQKKFNKSKDHISHLLKPFKEHNLIDIINIKTRNTEYVCEEYKLNERGMEVAYTLIKTWVPNETLTLFEYIANLNKTLLLLINYLWMM